MGMLASPWDDAIFVLKGYIAYGTIACMNWPPKILHRIGATVHVLADLAIDAALAANPDTNLLGPFSSTDSNVEPLCIHKTIYLPAPFVGIFLRRYLMLVESCTRLHSAIVDRGLEVDCCYIIDWIFFPALEDFL